MKRTPLRRSAPLRSKAAAAEPRQHWVNEPKKKRKRPSGAVRRANKVRAEVYERDGYACQFPHAEFDKAPACWPSALTPHHRRKAGQGGGYMAENLVACCAPANDWIEEAYGADRALLVELGWIVLRTA